MSFKTDILKYIRTFLIRERQVLYGQQVRSVGNAFFFVIVFRIPFRVRCPQAVGDPRFLRQRAKLFSGKFPFDLSILNEKHPVDQIAQVIKAMFHHKDGISILLQFSHDFSQPFGRCIIQIGGWLIEDVDLG